MNKDSSARFYQVTFLSVWLLIFVFLSTVGDEFLPRKYFWDSEILLGMMKGYIISDVDDGSYYYTVKIFSILGYEGLWALNSAVALIFISYCSKYALNLKLFVIISFLIIPHIILGMIRPQKELIVTMIALMFLFGSTKFQENRLRNILILLSILYLSYSVVRIYYLVIFLVFLYLYWIVYGISNKKTAVSLSILIAILFLPPSILESIQGTRDVFNSLRPSGIAGHQTVYFNPFPPSNGIYFILNYFSAFFYFNFPLASYINLNSIFLQVYVFVVGYVFLIHQLKARTLVVICMLLFASHVIVLILFEPDSGSYLRHLSSVVIYILPALSKVLYERHH